MNVFNNITSGTRAALSYITIGALTIVWSALFFVYLRNHPPEPGTDMPFYWCTGFLLSGMTLLAIGLAVGWIGRNARQAEQMHAIVNTQDNFGNTTQGLVPVQNAAQQAAPVQAVAVPAVQQAPPQPLTPQVLTAPAQVPVATVSRS